MSDLDQSKPEKSGMRRSLKFVLFVSLALNLAVAGVVIGAVAKHGFEDDRRAPRIEGPGGPLTRALSKEDRREIGRALRAEFGALRPTREDIQAQYAKVVAALKATPYDAKTVRMVVTAQSEAMNARMRAGQEQLLGRLDDMSPDERAAFAERLQEVLERAPQKRVEKSGGRRDGF